MVIAGIGVIGSGRKTVVVVLVPEPGRKLYDADAYHSAANKRCTGFPAY
jgi:hypothetical protein